MLRVFITSLQSQDSTGYVFIVKLLYKFTPLLASDVLSEPQVCTPAAHSPSSPSSLSDLDL